MQLSAFVGCQYLAYDNDGILMAKDTYAAEQAC
jgi:hypothetical protein